MLAAQQAAISGIQSTAGAVPVRNEKGFKFKAFLIYHKKLSFFVFR